MNVVALSTFFCYCKCSISVFLTIILREIEKNAISNILIYHVFMTSITLKPSLLSHKPCVIWRDSVCITTSCYASMHFFTPGHYLIWAKVYYDLTQLQFALCSSVVGSVGEIERSCFGLCVSWTVGLHYIGYKRVNYFKSF